jgi:hypothetical protein
VTRKVKETFVGSDRESQAQLLETLNGNLGWKSKKKVTWKEKRKVSLSGKFRPA